MSLFPDELLTASQAFLAALQKRALLVVTAESCTGGLLAGLLTEQPGASAMFERGFVTYSNAAKTADLGVPPEILARHGAVSIEAAAAMAKGALERTPAHVAVAITGIAGPDGGSPEKPVGYVCFAVAFENDVLTHEARYGDRPRQEIRLASLADALRLAHGVIDRA